jgi:pyruvate-formate lyase
MCKLDDQVLREISEIEMTERVRGLRDAYFRAIPEVCTERAKLVTEFCKGDGKEKPSLFNKKCANDKEYEPTITSRKKAELYNQVLKKRNTVIWHREARELKKVTGDDGEEKNQMIPFAIEAHSLFAGSTTSHFKGVPLYPEFIATWMWPELDLIQQREKNPYYLFGSAGNPISESQRRELKIKNAKTEDEIQDNDITLLNETVFPYWIDKNITELGRARARAEAGITGDTPEFERLQNVVFYLTTKPNCISHTIPSFEKAINNGLKCIIDEAKTKKKEAEAAPNPNNPGAKDFYKAVIEAMNGIIEFSTRLAAEAKKMAKSASGVEHQELEKLASIHERIPREPANDFRDGLTTIWMCWIALHLENANAAMSLGRLDQLLGGLYEKDLKLCKSDDEKTLYRKFAVELLCCFWLKIGDHVPMVPSTGEKLFGGTGSNQAITIGGVTEEGKDAVNELTFVILRSIELMRLRDPNLNARYHPEFNKPEYLRRLCEVNLNTGATPALHNDMAVIKALLKTTGSDRYANDYGIVGCVEPVSSGRTFGHTGAILLNLVSVLELTLFDGKHRLLGISDKEEPVSEIKKKVADCKKFKEFLSLFFEHTTWLVAMTVRLNNLFGRIHQGFYPTPILSSLFDGPMKEGKDLVFGGATLNSSGVAIIGFADVVDSLAAIQKWIFTNSTDMAWAKIDGSSNPVTPKDAFKGFIDAMCRDFGSNKKDYEKAILLPGETIETLMRRDARLYALLRNPERTPKFGNPDAALVSGAPGTGGSKPQPTSKGGANGMMTAHRAGGTTGSSSSSAISPGGSPSGTGGSGNVECDDPVPLSVDEIATELVTNLNELYGNQTNYREGRYRVGYWSMTNHAGFGRLSHSTPNGRRKGENFASGITPVSGMTSALPYALDSVAGLPAEAIPNGMALNIKFPPVVGTKHRKNMLNSFITLVNEYFNDGGMEIQFNITSRQDFIEAKQHPEAYPTLLVRVSGYTAYFKDLNPQMQDEIIERTEYGLLAEQVVNLAAHPHIDDAEERKLNA